MIEGVHLITMGMANAYLIEADDGLTLIDAGYPRKESSRLRRDPRAWPFAGSTQASDFHSRPPGSYRERRCDRAADRREDVHAPAGYPHGGEWRSISASASGTGSARGTCCASLLYHPDERVHPVAINQPLIVGEILPIAGGFEVIHTPGHCAGQVALLWRPGRMLFAGDVCMNIMGLGDPLGFESLQEGRASQCKVASLSFDAAGLGHGEPIARDASTRFCNKWGKKNQVDHRAAA